MAKENEASETTAIEEEEHEPSEHSYWPIVVSVSVLLIGVGFLTSFVVSAIGVVALLVGLAGWFNEPWVS